MLVASAAIALTLASVAWACTPSGAVTVDPGRGAQGTQVTVTAQGYGAERVDVYLYSQTGERTALAASTPDARGGFSTTVTVPAVPPGVYTVVGEQAATTSDGRAVFEVIAPEPPSGSPNAGAGEPSPTSAFAPAPAPVPSPAGAWLPRDTAPPRVSARPMADQVAFSVTDRAGNVTVLRKTVRLRR